MIKCLTPDLSGKEVTCNLQGTLNIRGKIFYDKQGTRWFIFQNYHEGGWGARPEMHPYIHSWSLGDGKEKDLKYHEMTDVQLVKKTKDNYLTFN